MKDNLIENNIFFRHVVNCFQKLLSSWWRTTFVRLDSLKVMLWIAFKNYYLRDEGQQMADEICKAACCELLSKIIIFVMKDNTIRDVFLAPVVVNCFQKLLSSWWRTTEPLKNSSSSELWIAFKNYYLRDEGQHSIKWKQGIWSCELLSKIIIFVMKDNNKALLIEGLLVVNCFQKLLSSWWRTTQTQLIQSELLLWIAFKNYYLRDEGQQAETDIADLSSCELLSKIIIFVMKDNKWNYEDNPGGVVNCFQKLLSSWWRTTHFIYWLVKARLWIAFKNYYLRDEGQQFEKMASWFICCELLSKIIIFVMKDNLSTSDILTCEVVNCFQKLLSSWWRTTGVCYRVGEFMLWIAFKNYYLRDEGQPDKNHLMAGVRCELLSKIIIFVMKDNTCFKSRITSKVVNCFQKLLSSWWRTTTLRLTQRTRMLWIAFKNYYLRDEGQLFDV